MPPSCNKTIPTYGQVSLDEDEKAYLNLPPKFCMYMKMELGEARYENLLCNSKLRWPRITSGSPKELEDEAQAETGKPPPNEEER